MKQNVILAGLCLSLFVSSSYAMSLRDSVESAINKNPNIIAEKKNQEAYKKYVDDREGRYLPTLDVEAYLETSKEHQRPNIGTRTTGTEEGSNVAVIFRQYLYDGGLTPSQVEETKRQEAANKYRSFYSIENTILEATKAYTKLVESDEKLVLTYGMIKTNEENLVTAKEKEEISGEVLETYQVSSKLNFVTDQYIAEQDVKDTGLANYFKFVGENINDSICRPVIDETTVPSTLKDAIELAILRNHKILEQIENIKKQREKIAQYDATFLPSLNLELKASYDNDLEINGGGIVKDAYARLNLNWNLFNGNRDNIRSKQEEIFLQEQKKTLDEVTNGVVLEIKSLYSKYFKNKQRIESLKKYVRANANIVEVYRNEFEAGTRTFVDILNAESELFGSSKSLITVEYIALNNYYDLMFNLSKLTDSILSSKNQICENIKPRVINYSHELKEKEISIESELNGLISIEDSALIQSELGLDNNFSTTSSTTSTPASEYKSFLEAPKSYYTINLATKNGMQSANSYIRNNRLGNDAYAFEFGPSMNSTKVLYGVYSSIKDAKRAMKSLGSQVLASRPYIDNISKHQALYSKYN